jgi:hypothetical protein
MRKGHPPTKGQRSPKQHRDIHARPRSALAKENVVPDERARTYLHRSVRRRYLSYPNVVGVGLGTKFTGGNATDVHHAVHFYVKKKVFKPARKLPAFVYARTSNGKLDRGTKLPTDVIEIGEVRFACGAGARVDNTYGNIGTVCLLFRNKNPSGGMFLITCAHVIKNSTDVACDCCPAMQSAGKVAFKASPKNGTLEFDVAVASLEPACSQSDLAIEGIGATLAGFMARSEIVPGLNVDCALPVSLVSNANVGNYTGTVQVENLLVENAHLLGASVMRGDSGGLLYSDNHAVGMVFALATAGWAFFHPIEDAVEFAVQQGNLNLKVF